MEALVLFHIAFRWLRILAEAATLIWLSALMLACFAWSVWGLHYVVRRVARRWRLAERRPLRVNHTVPNDRRVARMKQPDEVRSR